MALRFVNLGHEVTCGGRSLKKLGSLSEKVKAVRINLEDKNTISDALKNEKPDIVYHAAALIRSRSLRKLRRVNVGGTKNVFDACLQEGVKKVIFLSSVSVINGHAGIPLTEDLPYKATNPYGRSKIEAEKVALEYRKKGLAIAILRPCMVYGEGEPHGLGLVVRLLKMRLLPIFAGGENKLHLVSVENVVDVAVLCISKNEAYEGTYIIADKEALSMKKIFIYITKVLGVKAPIIISKNITKALVKVPFIGSAVSLLTKERLYAIDRLKEKFGYIPRVSVYDGLKRAVEAL